MLLEVTRTGVRAPVPVDPTGRSGPTRGQSRGRAWRRTSANRFVPSCVADSLDQRIVEAAAAAPEGSAVTGWAALAWCGAAWFDGTAPARTPLPVPIALGDRRTAPPCAGLAACNDWLFTGEVVQVDGLPVTVPERSVSFEARRARTDHRAVCVIDMAYAADLTDPARLAGHLDRLAGRPGIRRARRALGRAEENAWSPMESLMRTWWQDTAGSGLLCNAPVFGPDGRHLLTPDLLDPVAAVAGEYNGAVRDGLEPRRRDLRREETYRELGIELVTMMSTDFRDLSSFATRIKRAYRRAAGAEGRRWTLEQPDWWVDTSTVARRRALTPEQRSRWLRGAA